MQEAALIAFTTFFATIGPVDAAVVFAALTAHNTPDEKKRLALRAVGIAAVILFIFVLTGETLLVYLGISLAAFRVAGGILLMLIGIDMVFARESGGTTATDAEKEEAKQRSDIAVFPIATPLIAGPGAIGAVILLIPGNDGDTQLLISLVLLAVLGLTYVLMGIAGKIQRLLGETGLHVISRIMGILLTALAVQFIFDGLIAGGFIG